MNNINIIQTLLEQSAHNPENSKIFFKTGAGHYAEHDQFIGITVPTLRTIAKEFSTLSLGELQELLNSPINEKRLLALIILVTQYQKGDNATKEQIFQFYLNNMQHVNNWNLVDSSAHLIVGVHLLDKDKQLLIALAQSKVLWERRIAMVATWYFIRQNNLEWTFTIAKMLLNDTHDLIHKAVGWMLREAGKNDENQLRAFLDQHAALMPRTMLRYALEKFPADERKKYLAL